nr:PspC domain-containing protein [Gordonia zhaorongruii]
MNDQLPPAGTSGTAPVPPPPRSRRLMRSVDDKFIGGVAGGLAEYFGVDSTWVRIAFVASIVLPGPQVLLYLLLWAVIPKA